MPNPPHRVWPLQGATNFRDLGGYRGHDGRLVRWQRLFRSDHLGHLTAADQALLLPLGVSHVFDFRGLAERAATPSLLPNAVTQGLPIEPTVLQSMQSMRVQGDAMSPKTMVALMQGLNRALVQRQSHRFKALFEHLLLADKPIVFHCTAGKDRTGLAAALILLALGVSTEDVMQDYLLTNQHYQRPVGLHSGLPEEAAALLWSVQESYLNAAFEAISQDHGSVAAYLAGPLGLGATELHSLRQRYLEP